MNASAPVTAIEIGSTFDLTYIAIALTLSALVAVLLFLVTRRRPVQPNWYFVLLAFEALLVAVFPTPDRWSRAVIIAVGTLLCLGEMIVVQNRSKEAAEMLRLLNAIHNAHGNPVKRRALELAFELRSFVSSLESQDPNGNGPQITVPFDLNESMRQSNAYYQSLNAFNINVPRAFATRFNALIERTLEDLEGVGADTRGLRNNQYPQTLWAMKLFAEHIEQVAATLGDG